MKNALDEACSLVQKHLDGLEEERSRLQTALDSLGGKSAKRGGRPKAARKRATRKSGTRAGQAVKLITDKPGITAAEIAKKMKIKPNYLYRVLGDLEKTGQIKKDGRKYNPVK